MSDWPDRYALYNYGYGNIDDVQIDVDPDGDYVKFTDFNKLLDDYAKTLNMLTRCFKSPVEQEFIKEKILKELSKGESNG